MAPSNESGIYRIRNTGNGKVYIGSAVNLRKRKTKHFNELSTGRHHSVKLQRAWLKHGDGNFVFEVLLICAKDHLLFYEQRAIDAFASVQGGYNVNPTAGSALGVKRSPESKERIAAAKRGKTRAPFSEEWRKAISVSHIGKRGCLGYKHTEEARANMRAREITDERRAAISLSLLGNTRALGFKHSDATRAKVSAAGMGNTNMLGKKLSDVTKAKIGDAQRGKPKSLEQRAKMAESAKRAWEKRKSEC